MGGPEQISISGNQLNEFISTCVPKNKRVLCLIVRDKVSRFNQAKSYFYPTYYLFIQAIIDIDELQAGAEQMAESPGSQSEEDIRGLVGGPPTSEENSFSASSSISADMMFIGAELSGARTAGASNQAAGAPGAPFSSAKMSGTSYSDNELCADTEDEDQDEHESELRLPAQTPDSSDQLQGRHYTAARLRRVRGGDPLIYPGQDGDSRSVAGRAASSGRQQAGGGGGLVRAQARSKMARTDTATSDEFNCQDDQCEPETAASMAQQAHSSVHSSRQQNKSAGGTDAASDARFISSLFVNERNPYTGTFGVLLTGRKRKKAKT